MKRGKYMFYEPKTLIIVYKDEMLANQTKKLIETKDDTEGVITGTRDNSINVVTWTEKIWLANKKAGNITSKVLFLGDIKGVDSLIPVIDVKFEKYGVRFGWAGNQAVIYVRPSEIKSIDSYAEFHSALVALPAPQSVKDAIKPRLVPTEKAASEPVEQEAEAESKGIIAKGKSFFKKAGNAIGDTFADLSTKAMIFSEENFKNKKAMERQMLFYGVICMYNDGLETFINA